MTQGEKMDKIQVAQHPMGTLIDGLIRAMDSGAINARVRADALIDNGRPPFSDEGRAVSWRVRASWRSADAEDVVMTDRRDGMIAAPEGYFWVTWLGITYPIRNQNAEAVVEVGKQYLDSFYRAQNDDVRRQIAQNVDLALRQLSGA
jgi:hypothetical protein